MSDITVLSVEELAQLLLKLTNGEPLSTEQIKQILFTIATVPVEVDEQLLETLKAQEQSEN